VYNKWILKKIILSPCSQLQQHRSHVIVMWRNAWNFILRSFSLLSIIIKCKLQLKAYKKREKNPIWCLYIVVMYTWAQRSFVMKIYSFYLFSLSLSFFIIFFFHLQALVLCHIIRASFVYIHVHMYVMTICLCVYIISTTFCDIFLSLKYYFSFHMKCLLT
jgi:hypothetical protein